jgi:hypothetical protein
VTLSAGWSSWWSVFKDGIHIFPFRTSLNIFSVFFAL